MIYGVIFLLLVLAILGYFKIAYYFNIIDKPNERSSHSIITIRGGGVIFSVAAILWFLLFGFQYPFFIVGLVLISIISFLDDRLTLSTKPRLAVHLLSVALMLYQLSFANFAWYWWLVGFILIIGWLNAFNFMDGINGITSFFSLAVLLPLWYVNNQTPFIETSLLISIGLSLVVFSYFNARKKAKTFAGDVGSISMGFILAFVLIALMLKTGNWVYVIFVAVYGIDAVLTIAQRLLRNENIFKAHRSHLYQYLANEAKWSHILVSIIYAVFQFLISVFVIIMVTFNLSSLSFILMLFALALFYIVIKISVTKRYVKT